MAWIKTINFEEANSKLKKIYNRVKGPNNNIDNVLTIHSLRPHSLVGHMTLYKSVLHNSNNTLPKWYLESLGVYVSHLNKCDYCVEHHYAGLKRLLNDNEKSQKFLQAVRGETLNLYFDERHFLGIKYAEKLTSNAASIVQKDVTDLVNLGFTEGEILEINQVTSYFNYVNRMVLGLGVNSKGDILGLSPNESNDPTNWEHK